MKFCEPRLIKRLGPGEAGGGGGRRQTDRMRKVSQMQKLGSSNSAATKALSVQVGCIAPNRQVCLN